MENINMNRRNKKFFVLCLIFVCCIVATCSCSMNKAKGSYDQDWIIGKTSQEIEDRYGKFDICLNEEKIEKNYFETGCGYLTKEQEKGAFGTSSDEFLMIFFDANGVAYRIEENYPRPGG